VVSPDLNVVVPAFAASDPGTTENTPIKGLVLVGPSGQSIPITSSWYDLTNSSNTLFMSVATTLAAYAVIQFRHKR
jgi:hypothetical protein